MSRKAWGQMLSRCPRATAPGAQSALTEGAAPEPTQLWQNVTDEQGKTGVFNSMEIKSSLQAPGWPPVQAHTEMKCRHPCLTDNL